MTEIRISCGSGDAREDIEVENREYMGEIWLRQDEYLRDKKDRHIVSFTYGRAPDLIRAIETILDQAKKRARSAMSDMALRADDV